MYVTNKHIGGQNEKISKKGAFLMDYIILLVILVGMYYGVKKGLEALK